MPASRVSETLYCFHTTSPMRGKRSSVHKPNRHSSRRILMTTLRGMLLVLAALLLTPSAFAQQPIKIGIVTFLSGAAAGAFGVPARNGFELVAEMLNAGRVPAPYAT